MKLLVSDVDGTLIQNDTSISQKNIEKMKQLQEEGHMIALCTGRNIFEMQRVLSHIDFPFDFLILNNGGHILDRDFHTLYEKKIDPSVGRDILDQTLKYPRIYSHFCDGQVSYSYRCGRTVDYGKEDEPFLDIDYQEAYRQKDGFQIIAFHQEDGGIEETHQCFDYIQKHYAHQVEAYYNLHYVDVVAQGCSKGQGVKTLRSLCQNVFDEVYAVGDSYNDLSMFQEADRSYTFAYAHRDIQQKAMFCVQYVYEVIEDMQGEKR